MNYIAKLLNINWLAQWKLNNYCKQDRMFVCRGKIQLSLDINVSIQAPDNICYIGIPLLGKSTPTNAVTVITAGRRSIVELDGVTIGRGVNLTIGAEAKLAIGNKSYIIHEYFPINFIIHHNCFFLCCIFKF